MMMLLLTLALQAQDDAEATKAVADFDAVYSKSKDSQTKVGAVATLAQTQKEKVVARLGALLTDPDKAVRIAAANALGTFKAAADDVHRSAAKALAGALSAGANAKELEVRVTILGAIGTLEEDGSANVLKSHFEDKDIKIASAAVSAAGALKCKAMVEPLIELLRECEKDGKEPAPAPGGKSIPKKTPPPTQNDPAAQKRERANTLNPTVQSALQTLTGQTFPNSGEWEKWWSKNRSTFSVTK